MGLKTTLVDTQFGGFVNFFLSSQYSINRHVSNSFDDINITVPPIWPCYLWRKFNALLENRAHFVNIVGEWGSKLRLSTPSWRLFRIFSKFLILHILSCFKLIPMILTLQCHVFHHTICNENSTLYSKMGRILSISWGNGAQNLNCRHPVWRLFRIFSKFLILHILSCVKLIPMILTLQCHVFHHTNWNGNSTLYSKMGRILSISWGNGAQNYVCRHPDWQLFWIFSKFLRPPHFVMFQTYLMILTLQCHLFDHTICNGNSTLYSKMGRILSISWGNGAQNYVCRHPVGGFFEFFLSSQYSINCHVSNLFRWY